MQIILMGAPGAGKGTQAAQIMKKFNIPQISTGDIFRAAVTEGTPLGKKAAEFMQKGALVPDEVTVGIMRERLSKPDCAGGFILDGFPRTVSQADALNKIFTDLNFSLDFVVNIHVPPEDLIERAVGRRICKNCGSAFHVKFKIPKKFGFCDNCGGELYQRADDSAETMKNRLSVYEASTRPLIDYYKNLGKYAQIDGRQPIDKVTSDIFSLFSC